MLNCLIVDDDRMSRLSLERLCGKMDALHVVASCENVQEAMTVVEKQAIDLFFLDIEMPGGSGFDLLESCAYVPEVIITTSKKEYAFEAFQYQVSDYLKKPILFPRFRQAVDKILLQHQQLEDRPSTRSPHTESIFIKVDGKFVQLKLKEVLYIENIGDYVRFHTEKENYVVYSTLKKLASKLPSDQFLKVHRSYIVNMSHIRDIEEGTIVIGNKVIPVSRVNRPILMDRLNLI
jgi:DNA-binding LytR/AlgR family response regulator